MFREAMTARYGADRIADHYRSFDTICSATQERQDAVIDLLNREALDLMVVVGGYNSSNTCNLARICADRVPTFHIAEPDCLVSADRIRHRPVPGAGSGAGAAGGASKGHVAEIESTAWLPPTGRLRVGLTAGASTPNSIIGTVVERLERFSQRRVGASFTPRATSGPFAGRVVPASKQPFRTGRIVEKRERRYVQNPEHVGGGRLDAGGRRTVGGGADLREPAGHGGGSPARGVRQSAGAGRHVDAGRHEAPQMVARRRSGPGLRRHPAAVEGSRSHLPADAADAEGEEGGRRSRGEGPLVAAGRRRAPPTNRRSCRPWRRWKRRAARCRARSR